MTPWFCKTRNTSTELRDRHIDHHLACLSSLFVLVIRFFNPETQVRRGDHTETGQLYLSPENERSQIQTCAHKYRKTTELKPQHCSQTQRRENSRTTKNEASAFVTRESSQDSRFVSPCKLLAWDISEDIIGKRINFKLAKIVPPSYS